MSVADDLNRATALHRAGRLAEAEIAYRKILSIEPNQFDAMHQLGFLRAQCGDMNAAAHLIGEALKANPNSFMAHFHLGNALFELGRKSEALTSYDRAIALNPHFAPAFVNRCRALHMLGRNAEALDACDRAVAIDPSLAEAYGNRSDVLFDLDRFDEALDNANKAISFKPNYAEAFAAQAAALGALGRLDEAAASYGRASALNPNSVEAYNNRSTILHGLGRFDEALIDADKAIALLPNLPQAHNNRGNALFAMGQWQDALSAFDRAIALNPDYAVALSNRCVVLRELGRDAEALAACDRAIAIAPNTPQAYNNRGNILHELGHLEDALADFEKAVALMPDPANAARIRSSALSMCFLLAAQLCDWHGYEAKARDLGRRCRQGQNINLFVLLSVLDDPELHLLAAKTAAAPTRKHICGAHAAHSRLRIAYLSADFCDHPVAHQAAELFEWHDHGRFESYGICVNPAPPSSAIRERLNRAFDHFEEVGRRSNGEIAQLLADRQIDIAVELGGYTDRARPHVLAHRPAPIAVTYLGYPGTSGADYIDYIIADAKVIPPECEEFYTEKIVRLPDCFMPADTKNRTMAASPSRKDVGLPENGFVFCAFNNSFKLNPGTFDIWMRLLHAVGGSVLWLNVQNATAQNNLRAEAVARKVSPERLIFAGRTQSREENFARLALADLYLDTHPYGAHATASDFLWAGVPILTVCGQSFASRVAASMLTALGMEELIAGSLADYQAMALALARAPEMLAEIRLKLTKARSSALFDMKRLCRNLERAYETMWDFYLKGRKPESFMVNPSVGPDNL